MAFASIRRSQPVLAGIAGAFLTATRAVGIGVGLAYLGYVVTQLFRNPEANAGKLLFAGLMIPVGLSCYMLFLHNHVGDAMAFSHIQRAWDREIGNPFVTLWMASKGNSYHLTMMAAAIFSLVISGYLMVKKEFGLALFLIFVTLIPLSTGTSSMARYVLLQPPLILAVTILVSQDRLFYPLVPLSIFGYLRMSYAWQEGAYYVI
jgi:hypothetical protein